MITKITTANADKYRALFAKATNALSVYDSQGHKPGQEGYSGPVISGSSYVQVDIDPSNYIAGEVWYGTGARTVDDKGVVSYEGYKQTELSEHFDENKEYFVEIKDGQITSLEEYFQYIKDLCLISPIFTVLPLDEAMFEIDANARTIKVPEVFQKNGVSVQGDQISEILYFKIDRFYDMEDLHGCDIFIEWRTPADANGKVYEGVSKPWAIDLESEPGYIIFGWPLSTEITTIPGDVTFAVRFYRFDSHVLKYSLSTLTNTVTIKPGINLENSVRVNLETRDAVTDKWAFIEDRLQNSEAYDPTARNPQLPKFDVNEASEQGSAKDIIIASKTNQSYPFYRHVIAANTESEKYEDYVVYLTDPVTGAEADGMYKIRSKVSDGGSLSYAWLKLDVDGNVYDNSRFLKEARGDGNNFVLTTDTSFREPDPDHAGQTVDNHKRYYYQVVNNEITSYKEYDGSRAEDLNPSEVEYEGSHLYELFYQVTLNAALEENGEGVSDDNEVISTYQPRITNRVGRKTDRVYGPVVRVEPPVKPVLVENPIVDGAGNVLDDTHGGILNDEDYKIAFYVTADVDAHGYTTFDWKRGHIDTDEESETKGQLVWTDLVSNDDPAEGRTGLSYTTVDHSKTVHKIYDDELRANNDTTDAEITANTSISAEQKRVHALVDTVTSYPMVIDGVGYGEQQGANGTGDGYYMVTVRTKLNSQMAVDPEEDQQNIIIRVTHPAEGVDLTYIRNGTEYPETYSFNVDRDEIPVQIVPKNNEIRTADDYYEYQWYRYGGNTGANAAEQNAADAASARQGNYVVREGVDEKIAYAYGKIDGKEGSPTSPAVTIRNTVGSRDDGLYFCVITNHYNGSTHTQSTRFINVTDYSDQ